MKKIIFVFLLLSFLTCESSKQAVKNKTSTEVETQQNERRDITNESSKVTERRVEGGSLSSDIIPLEKRERDDSGAIKLLIDEIKDGGLTKTIYYKPDGSVSVECKLAELFETIQEENRQTDNSIILRFEQLEQSIKDKDSSKETSTKDSFIWALFGSVVVIMLFAMFLFYKVIDKRLKALDTIKIKSLI